MRSSAASQRSKPALLRALHATGESSRLAALDAWRARALRDVSTVRRVLRAESASGCVAGSTATVDALERGVVQQLIFTPRFTEMHADASAKALDLARAGRCEMITVTGAAAFELDLVAGGIGAVLRRRTLALVP